MNHFLYIIVLFLYNPYNFSESLGETLNDSSSSTQVNSTFKKIDGKHLGNLTLFPVGNNFSSILASELMTSSKELKSGISQDFHITLPSYTSVTIISNINNTTSCNENADCTTFGFSECINKKCLCKFASKKHGTLCTKLQLYDECMESKECTDVIPNSMCSNGSCVCQLGYGDFSADVVEQNSSDYQLNDNRTVNSERNCNALKIKEGKCRNDNDCKVFNNYSICLEHHCICDKRYYEVDNGISNQTVCMLRMLNMGVCENDEECHISVENSMCNEEKVCVCKYGYLKVVKTNNISKTVTKDENFIETFCKGRTLEDNLTCSFAEECSSTIINSDCINKTCQCRPNYVIYNSTFCRSPIMTDTCKKNETCSLFGPNSYCSSQQQCQCDSGYVADENLSYCMKRKIGSFNCNDDFECFEAVNKSVCIKGRCLCEDGYGPEENETRCAEVHIGTICESDEICTQAITQSFCDTYSSSCQCQSGFKIGDSTFECVKFKIGESGCYKNKMCEDAVDHSFCELETLKCQCVSGYAVNNESIECVRRKIGDKNCGTKQDCSDSISNGFCSQIGECICEVGYFQNSSYSCIKRSLHDDSTCNTDIDCFSVINSSICIKNQCKCVTGYIETDDFQHCRARILKDKCLINVDCVSVIENSICAKNLCSCSSGYAAVEEKLCQKRKIGDANCLVDKDCSDAVEHSECIPNKDSDKTQAKKIKVCQCVKGYYEDFNRTVCTKRQIGDLCNNDDDCSQAVAFSECTNNNCSCDYDHMVKPPNYKICVDRPIIEQYKPMQVLGEFRGTYGCGKVERYHKLYRQCPRAQACPEAWRHRGMYRKETSCYRANAYVLKVNLSKIVGKYELVPLIFNDTFIFNETSDVYWKNSVRLSFYGIDKIIKKLNDSLNDKYWRKNLKSRYKNKHYTNFWIFQHKKKNKNAKPPNIPFNHIIDLNNNQRLYDHLVNSFLYSKVVHFSKILNGIQAEIALFFSMNSSILKVPFNETIENLVLFYLHENEGEIGNTKMYVTKPHVDNIKVEDFDECHNNYSIDRGIKEMDKVDCDLNAVCINTVGFYRCLCKPTYSEKSPTAEFKGRVCRGKDNVVFEFEVDVSKADCTDGKCQTPWLFVIFATTIIFGLLFLLLIVEIVWRMKQMSRVLDEKCRRQTEEMERKLMKMKEERRRHIKKILKGNSGKEDDSSDESQGNARKGRVIGKVFVEEEDKEVQTVE